ncbi:nucleotide pyrophosphohydrolase [Candidatus Babeliales bacterium]|nr:nucleotide pyrophosphohydrolase [Candidatus Babeliales bacterium]
MQNNNTKKNDLNVTLQELKILSDQFTIERDWKKFHSPKDMATQLSVESNELLAHFLYMTNEQSYDKVEKNRQAIEDEAADCLLTLLNFCNESKIDLTAAFFTKLKKLQDRYPAIKK